MLHFKLRHPLFLFTLLICFASTVKAQSRIDKLLPVRAFCIAAPKANNVDRFIKFINEELPSANINTLILRVDFNYEFESHPELRDSIALSKQQVKQLVAACEQNNIRLIPQINLLGHQSWAGTIYNLLKVYPHLDETPHIKMPEKYTWPNEDSLYCKSYCPLHPDVHAIVFDLMDEICDVFEADAFHAGMDEVFYIGNYKCPRCSGKDRAVLFANEVNAIQNQLALKKRNLWIWGDRLIDGRTTGVGEWEGSFNDTHPAIDLVSKKITICDWHYEKAEQTPVYFAGKGLNVITSTWRTPSVAVAQIRDMIKFRRSARGSKGKRHLGIMQTVWSGTEPFLDQYYAAKLTGQTEEKTPANCFLALINEINILNSAVK